MNISSAFEVTTIWRYTNVYIIIIIILSQRALYVAQAYFRQWQRIDDFNDVTE